MKYPFLILLLLMSYPLMAQPRYDLKSLQREQLGRGVVVCRTAEGDSVSVSWRYLEEDDISTGFNVYRDGKKINKTPVTASSYLKLPYEGGATYEVRTVDKNKESHRKDGRFVLKDDAPKGYLSVPLEIPEGGTTPDGRRYDYSANDASVVMWMVMENMKLS